MVFFVFRKMMKKVKWKKKEVKFYVLIKKMFFCWLFKFVFGFVQFKKTIRKILNFNYLILNYTNLIKFLTVLSEDSENNQVRKKRKRNSRYCI